MAPGDYTPAPKRQTAVSDLARMKLQGTNPPASARTGHSRTASSVRQPSENVLLAGLHAGAYPTAFRSAVNWATLKPSGDLPPFSASVET